VEHGVVVDGERHVARLRELPELARLGARERQRLLDERADAAQQQVARDRDVQVRWHENVGDVDLQRLELGNRGHGRRDRVPARGRLCAGEVGVAHRDDLDARRRTQDLEVELRDEARADDGDTGRAGCERGRHGSEWGGGGDARRAS